MKRFFFLLSAVVVSLTMAAQMQVWSNGTIIFSHDQAEVDSISFGNPMQVQSNYNALSSTSLAGCVYTTSLSGGGFKEANTTSTEYGTCLLALYFLDSENGYYGFNYQGTCNAINKVITFSYIISGNDISISISGNTYSGKVIGKNGLVFPTFFCDYNNTKTYPMCFINLNR
ncbi:MAG: hypothetical protein IJ915_06735 [Paludibacteraceae bacterium]|nr:hypothetical protein [Paludibacteraceae bacterium]